MKRRITTLLCLLCCLSLLTGCGLLDFGNHRTPSTGSSSNSGSAVSTVPTMDVAEGPAWIEKIREEMLSGGTAVEQTVSDTVELEVGDVTEHSVEVIVLAPDIYDEMTDWYTATPEEERSEEAVMEKIETTLEETEPEEQAVILELEIIDTEPHIIYTEEFLQWLSCGLRWFFQRFEITAAPDFCQEVDSLSIDFDMLRQEILLQTLMTEYYDTLNWTRQDVDLDGSRELLLEVTDFNVGRPSQMLLDTNGLWSYTTTGAAQFTSFLQVDGRWAFEDTYATVGTQLYDLYFWDGSQWFAHASYHAEASIDADGNFTPVVSSSHWNGQEVTQEEFDALWAQHCAVPEYDSPDLHVQTALGDWESLISKLDAWLTEHFTCLRFERADFNGDGVEDCFFVLDNAANDILAGLTAENIWGGEAFLTMTDDCYTIIGMEQTENGAKLTVSRILPSGTYDPNIMDKFYVDENGGLCFGQESRYIYVAEYEGFAQDMYVDGMDAPAFSVPLLDLLYLEEAALSDYLTDITNYGGGYITGYLDGVLVSTISDYNNAFGSSVVHTVIVDGFCSLSIDGTAHMGMSAAEIWENIDCTETPWMERQATELSYATSVYYDHPIVGDRFRIDLFFDGLEDSARLTGIYIMPA